MNTVFVDQVDWEKIDNFLPVIVQDYLTRQVLMLGYMNREALQQTITTSRVTFFSRSKNRLWVKGETSGHFLDCIDLFLDCDQDSLLILAKAQGPTCHQLTTSCFSEQYGQGIGFIAVLDGVIASRKQERPEKSYTTQLFDEGITRIAQKVGEEGVEVALAAATAMPTLSDEAADLIFHLLVLLQASNTPLTEVLHKLQERHKPK